MIVPTDWRGPTIAADIDRFVTELESNLGDRMQVERIDPSTSDVSVAVTQLTPTNAAALAIRIEIDNQFARIRAGHYGGHWELHDDDFNADLIQAMAQAVVTGRATEVFGPNRSTVTLALADGTTKTDTGIYGLLNMVTPRPGWRRRGTRGTYPSY